MNSDNKIVLFQEKQIRRTWHDEQWYFAVVDVIETLTDSSNPRDYWYRLKKRELESSKIDLSTICRQLKVESSDGKKYTIDCSNTEGVFRLIMSIPSPKAEPFKLWLAQVGKEKIEEIENPELGFERMTEIYRMQGRTDEWIKERIQSIETRKRLTDEWKNRGVIEGKEYSYLTAIIAKGTFELTPTQHKDFKGLTKPNQNLRDHMTPLELIFAALGEELTRDEAVREDAQGFNENKTAAVKGGSMAGKARKLIEKERGAKVVSKENFLKKIEQPKEIEKPKEE